MKPKNTDGNSFSLRRLKKECYYAPIAVDFSPMEKLNVGSIAIIPKYNNDSKYYSNAFINPFLEAKQVEDPKKEADAQMEKFLQKIENQMSKPVHQKVMFNPSNDNYCSVCDKNFSQYWEHINNPKHRMKLRRNKANKFIHDLCNNYTTPNKTTKNKQMKKREKKQKPLNKKPPKTPQKVKQTYCREDFIITIPKQFLSKDFLQGSTNGANEQHKS